MTLLANTSCLVTEGLEPRETEPPPTNSWPRIIQDSISPKNTTPVVTTGDVQCLPVDLAIGKVADENTEQDLSVRVFVDGEFKDQTVILKTSDSTKAVERLGPTYTFLPSQWCRGFHVVRVLVADGEFAKSGAFDALRDPANHGLVECVWAVDTSACPDGAGSCR